MSSTSMAAAISSAHAASTAAAAAAAQSSQSAGRKLDERSGGTLPRSLMEGLDVEGEVSVDGVVLSGTVSGEEVGSACGVIGIETTSR